MEAMVRILDGSSKHGAHVRSKSGVSICWRHLVTSKESSNPILFLERLTLLHTCATFSELPSYINTIVEIEWEKRRERKEERGIEIKRERDKLTRDNNQTV